MTMNKYKDLILDIDTGELKQAITKPKKHQEDMSTLEHYVNNPHLPIFGLGVTEKYLRENCLKPGDKCRRFHMVHLSDGGSQGVQCRWGPYKKCEKAMERIWQW